MPEPKNKRVGGPPSSKKKLDQDQEDFSARAKELEESVIALSPEQQKDLAEWMASRVDAALNCEKRTEAVERIKDCREAYEKGVARTEIPMNNGYHDYRSFEAASATDGTKARLIGIFTSEPVIKIEGRNKIGVRNAPSVEKFLDHHHDQHAKLSKNGDLISDYLSKEGHAVLYSPWRFEMDSEYHDFVEKQYYAVGSKKILVDLNDPDAVQKARGSGMQPIEDYEVEEVVRPEIIKNWPDLRVVSYLDKLVPKGSVPTKAPAWEAIREEFTLAQLQDMEDKGQIYAGSVKKLKTYLTDPSGDEEEEDIASKPGKPRKINPPKADDLDAVVKCWVIWGLIKVPGKDKLQKQTLLYHHEAQHALQLKANKYIGKRSPFFDLRLIMLMNRDHGVGTMELSMPSEQMQNDILNYVLDQTRILSALPITYLKKKMPNGINLLEFMKGLGVDRHDNIAALNIPDRRQIDLGLLNVVRAHSERRNGIGDLQLGRESDINGKQPRAVGTTVSILREGQVKFNLFNFSLFNVLLEWADFEICLFQQYLGRKTVIDTTDADGNLIFPDGLTKRQILGSFRYQPNVSAQSLARELDAQLNLVIYDHFKDNPLYAKCMSAFYNMTNDTVKALGKEDTWLPPLAAYQAAAGRVPGEETFTPEEKQAADAMKAQGVPVQEIKKQIDAGRQAQQNGTATEPVKEQAKPASLDPTTMPPDDALIALMNGGAS